MRIKGVGRVPSIRRYRGIPSTATTTVPAVMSSPWLGAFQDNGEAVSNFGPALVDLHRNGLNAQDGPSHDFWVAEGLEILCMRTSEWYWLGSYSESLKERISLDLDCQVDGHHDPLAPATCGVEGEGLGRSFFERVKRWFAG